MSRKVGRELRGMRLCTGGLGVAMFCRRNGRLASSAALHALILAAQRLGFKARRGLGNFDWQTVVDALAAGALPDVLSEAIEEQEAP